MQKFRKILLWTLYILLYIIVFIVTFFTISSISNSIQEKQADKLFAEREASTTSQDDPYIDLLDKGDEFWVNGSTTDAMRSWKTAEALDPSRPEAYVAESMPATSTEEMRLLNLAISKSDTYTPAYELRADAYNRQGKFKLALADATKAIELGGYTYHVYVYRTMDYLNLHNDASALSDIQEAIKMNPDDGQSYMLKGRALYNLGICQDAIYAFNDAVDISKGGEIEIKMRDYFMNNFDAKKCVDSPDDSGQKLPTSTSTPTNNPMSGAGV